MSKFETIQPDDVIYQYTFKFHDVSLVEGKDLTGNNVLEGLYRHLLKQNIQPLSLCNCDDGNPKYLFNSYVYKNMKLSITFFLFRKISSQESKFLKDVKNYEMIKTCKSITMKLEAAYLAKDMKLSLYLLDQHEDEPSACGCPMNIKKEFPVVGLFKGDYLNVEEPKKKKYLGYMYASAWNYKSLAANQSINKLLPERIRTASFTMDTPNPVSTRRRKYYANDRISLGFGWEDATKDELFKIQQVQLNEKEMEKEKQDKKKQSRAKRQKL